MKDHMARKAAQSWQDTVTMVREQVTIEYPFSKDNSFYRRKGSPSRGGPTVSLCYLSPVENKGTSDL